MIIKLNDYLCTVLQLYIENMIEEGIIDTDVIKEHIQKCPICETGLNKIKTNFLNIIYLKDVIKYF